MNPSTLTAREILRMCTPMTDLEVRLFEIATELQDECDSAAENPEQSYNYGLDDCDECENKLSDIEAAIDLIEAGKITDALDKLKAIT